MLVSKVSSVGIVNKSTPTVPNKTIPVKVKDNSHDVVSFKGMTPHQIETIVKNKHGVDCHFNDNSLVADCTRKVVDLFSELFSPKHLPDSVSFVPFYERFGEGIDVTGMHVHSLWPETSEIYFNSDCKGYRSKNRLELEGFMNKIVWWSPVGHYLQTFVHEFGHSAHYRNLSLRDNARMMDELRSTRIPTVVGRFITKFKLGRYAATNMNEFMAERITKDVCKNLSQSDRFYGNKEDLNYSNIFSSKWKYRYSTPQAYLDYYTQQVWNGDTHEAVNAVGKMEEYLAKVEAEEKLAAMEKTSVINEQPVTTANGRKLSFWERLSNRFFDSSPSLVDRLNKQNDIILRNKGQLM